jgi:hypothetical protein
MRRSLIAGLVLALLAALITALGGIFGSDLEHVALLGAALGGALGLIPHRFAWGRITGFLLGFAAAWIGFALRAAVLPDSSNGRAVAAFLVVALCAVACAFSRDRLPLWSALLGAAAIIGAYEEIYTNAPSQFISESPEAGTTVLLAVAFGYLATSVVYDLMTAPADAGAEGNAGAHSQTRVSPSKNTDANPDSVGQVDDLMTGEKK